MENMEFDKVVEKRRSIRSFKKKAANWRVAIEAIDSIRNNPFAGNKNNLHFIIVEDSKKIDNISKCCEQDWILDSNLLVLVCSDESLIEEMYGERGRIYSRQQAGAAIMTLLLKLTDAGAAACWVGAYNDKEIRDILKIPEKINIEAVIPIGYASGKNEKPRKNEPKMYWESWGERKRPTIFTEPGIHDNI